MPPWLSSLIVILLTKQLVTADDDPGFRRCPATGVACSADGRWVVTVGESEFCVHDARSLAIIQRLELPCPAAGHVRFLSDGQLVVTGGTPGESGALVVLRAVSEQPPQFELSQHVLAGSDVLSASAAGIKEQIAAGYDRALHRGLLADADAAASIEAAHSRPITDIVSDPARGLLISSGADNTIRVWNPESLTQLRALNNHARAVRGLALRPKQDATALPWLASAADDRTLRFWQPTIGRMVRFKRLKSAATCVTWLHDGSLAVVGCRSGHVCFVDPDSLMLRRIPVTQDGWVTGVSAVPGTNDVIAAATDGTLRRISSAEASE